MPQYRKHEISGRHIEVTQQQNNCDKASKFNAKQSSDLKFHNKFILDQYPWQKIFCPPEINLAAFPII